MVGAGLLGASIGLGLRAAGLEVYLQDISPTVEAVAEDIGAGTRLDTLEPDERESFTPQLVVVASPPDIAGKLCIQALREYAPSPGYAGATVTDIASVKVQPLEQVLASDADASRYVGSHPMAGREKTGPVAARGELFQARPWIICEHDDARIECVRLVRALAVELGSFVTTLSAEEHDENGCVDFTSAAGYELPASDSAAGNSLICAWFSGARASRYGSHRCFRPRTLGADFCGERSAYREKPLWCARRFKPSD